MRSDNCKKLYTDRDKWIVAVISAVLFLIIASPFMYNFTNSITSSFGLVLADSRGYPLMSGLLVHALIFLLIIRLLMR